MYRMEEEKKRLMVKVRQEEHVSSRMNVAEGKKMTCGQEK